MLIVAVVAIAALLAAGAFAAITTSNITVPVPVTENSLSGLACTAPGRCVAVGSTGSRYTIRVPFALRSEAGTWTPSAPVPPLDNGDSYFLSIVCASDTRCIAVGGQDKPAPYLGAKSGGGRPLVEAFTGDAWRIQQVSTPSGTSDAQLSGVDCVRSTCMAVGSVGDRAGHERVMTQLWEGKSWKMILPPRPRTMEDPNLGRASRASPRRRASAVGQFTYELGFSSLLAPLILRWDGTQWRFEHPGGSASRSTPRSGRSTAPPPTCASLVGSAADGAGHLFDVRAGPNPRDLARERDAESPALPGRRSPRRRVPERDQMRRGGIRGSGIEPEAARRMVERFALDDRTRTRCARCERKHAERSPMHITDELRGGRQLPARLADRARVHSHVER